MISNTEGANNKLYAIIDILPSQVANKVKTFDSSLNSFID